MRWCGSGSGRAGRRHQPAGHRCASSLRFRPCLLDLTVMSGASRGTTMLMVRRHVQAVPCASSADALVAAGMRDIIRSFVPSSPTVGLSRPKIMEGARHPSSRHRLMGGPAWP